MRILSLTPDPATKKCTPVTKTIANCDYYSGADVCSHCILQHYFDPQTKECAKSSNFIENCNWYTADSQCSSCKVGKVAPNKGSCITNPLFSECIFYSGELSCYKCKDGNTLDHNKYLFDMDTSDVLAKIFYENDVTNRNTSIWFMKTPDDICLPSVTNCSRFNYFNDCATCVDGYFVGTDGGCIKNPLTKIENCLQYKTATECTSCMKEFYLDANICKPQDKILGCIEYSITTKGVCDLCNPESFFDSGSGSCKKRELTIKHCVTYQPTSDSCKTCAESYILSNANTECSSAISKCTNYYFLPTADGGQRTVCQACLDGFYLRTQISGADIITSCELPSPSILGCIVYTSNDYCSKCTTGYYLANGRCHTHNSTIIDKLQCVSYSTIRLNECSKCPDENYLYTLYNYCENLAKTELITNCNQYDTNKNCYQCSHPYYVKTTLNQQTNITEYSCQEKKITDCITLDRVAPKCLDCNRAVKKIPNNNVDNNKCVTLPDFQSKNCVSYDLDSTNLSPKCSVCQAPYYPITWPDLHYGLCADPEQIKELYFQYTEEDKTSFDNCDIIDLKQQKKCRRCNQAKVGNIYKNLISGSFECGSTCTSEEVIETFGFDSNIAAPVSYMACKTKLLVASFGELDNCYRIDYDNSSKSEGNFLSSLFPICVQCKTGYLGVVNDKIKTKYVIYDYRQSWEEANLKETAGFKEQGFWNPHNKIPGYYYCIKFDDYTTHQNVYFEGTIAAANFPNDAGMTGESRVLVKANYNDPTKSFIQHCSSLIEKTLNFGCRTCKWGYRGLEVQATGQDFNIILSCTPITDCDTNTIYTAVGGHDNGAFLHMKVTCHKCNTATFIPTITSQPINSTFTGTKQFFTTECMKEGQPTDTAANDVAFITNCGVQEIVKGIPQWQGYKDEFPHPNPVCIACKPGYRPTLSSTVSNGESKKGITRTSVSAPPLQIAYLWIRMWPSTNVPSVWTTSFSCTMRHRRASRNTTSVWPMET